MLDKIGETAGKVWKVLEEKEKVTLSQLPKQVKEKESLTYQAIGWLAREGKIDYSVQGNKTFVSLNRGNVNQ